MSDAKAPEGEGDAKPKGKGKLIIIIVAVVLVLGGGGAAFFLMGGKDKKAEGDAAHAEEEKVYASIQLDTFIVNLSNSGSFLKTTLMIEYDTALIGAGDAAGGGGGGGHGGGGSGGGDAKAKGLPGVLGKREPMIRDAVIRTLSGKKGEEVMTLSGKETLKEELVDAINEAIGLDEGPVVAVYFLEFLVQ